MGATVMNRLGTLAMCILAGLHGSACHGQDAVSAPRTAQTVSDPLESEIQQHIDKGELAGVVTLRGA
jgi:hypothetical protein